MNKITSFKPLLNRILIKRFISKQKTAGGLILSNTSKSERFGLIVSAGPGSVNKNGKTIPLSVKVGEYVLLPEYSGARVEMQDSDKEVEYMVYKDTEILGALEGVKRM